MCGIWRRCLTLNWKFQKSTVRISDSLDCYCNYLPRCLERKTTRRRKGKLVKVIFILYTDSASDALNLKLTWNNFRFVNLSPFLFDVVCDALFFGLIGIVKRCLHFLIYFVIVCHRAMSVWFLYQQSCGENVRPWSLGLGWVCRYFVITNCDETFWFCLLLSFQDKPTITTLIHSV